MARKQSAPNLDPTSAPVRYMKVPPFVEVMEITETNARAVGEWSSATVSRDDTGKTVVILRKMPPPYNKGRAGDLVVKNENGEFRIANKYQFLDVYVVAPE